MSDAKALQKNKHLPRGDHTTRSFDGNYAYATPKNLDDLMHFETFLALNITNELKSGSYCFSLWAINQGPSESSLSVQYGSKNQIIQHSETWHLFEVDFVKAENEQFRFAIVATPMTGAVYAIDDISFAKGQCSNRDTKKEVYTCNFNYNGKLTFLISNRN